MLIILLALAVFVLYRIARARVRPLKMCRRCVGLGCKHCDGAGRRFRLGARRRRSTEMRNL